MTLREQLILVANRYAHLAGLSLSRVSTIVFNDGKTLMRLQAEGDITTTTFERAMAWFSGQWPDDAVWPEGIARPRISKEAAE